ncbi:MAG: hypothetical protein IJ491_04750 [Clostridia bacterium]|nr:hypothetical protein [Clostridia bacterium]
MEKRKLKIIIAAVVAAVVVLAGCIGAYVVNKNNNEKEIITPGELLNILNETGIYDPVLPQIFFDEGNEITLEYTQILEDGTAVAVFGVYIKELDMTVGTSLIENHEKNSFDVERKVNKTYHGVTDYTVDGIYILHFYEPSGSYFTYNLNSIDYSFVIDECSVEIAQKIINSIKRKGDLK